MTVAISASSLQDTRSRTGNTRSRSRNSTSSRRTVPRRRAEYKDRDTDTRAPGRSTSHRPRPTTIPAAPRAHHETSGPCQRSARRRAAPPPAFIERVRLVRARFSMDSGTRTLPPPMDASKWRRNVRLPQRARRHRSDTTPSRIAPRSTIDFSSLASCTRHGLVLVVVTSLPSCLCGPTYVRMRRRRNFRSLPRLTHEAVEAQVAPMITSRTLFVSFTDERSGRSRFRRRGRVVRSSRGGVPTRHAPIVRRAPSALRP